MAAIAAESDKFYELVDEGTELEKLADGFGFLEGLVWDKSKNLLNFSDITQDTRRVWHASGEVEVVEKPSNISNGMTLEADGTLLICLHATSSIVRETASGQETIASHYDGKELNSPNDIVVAPDGSIYFTDPPYGRFPGWGIEREQDLDFQGVFRLANGELQLVVKDIEGPNGLTFTPDFKRMYINDTAKAHIRVFDVQSDGSLTGGEIFAEGIGNAIPEEGVVDGMKVDERGNVWVTGPGGIWVFTPEGEHLGKVQTPEGVGNFCWGGDDYKTLFIGACSTLWRIPTKVASKKEPYMK